jgi:Glycosyl hydrolases family 8
VGAMWTYVAAHLDAHGLMNWHINEDGSIGDSGGATDGDFDIAMALVIMHRLHGSTGAYNWNQLALTYLDAILTWEFTPANYAGTGGPNIMMNGDQWGVDTDNYMPDYLRAAWMREFATFTGNPRWLTVLNTNYTQALQYYYDNYLGGGVPDRQTRTHTSLGASNDQVSYNSVRLGFGVATDYLWNGPSVVPAICTNMMNKMANRSKAVFGTGGNVRAIPYDLNLTVYEGYSNLAGWGHIGPATLLSPTNQTFSTEIYNAMDASGEVGYFNAGVALMSMASMSGIAQPYSAASSNVVTGGRPKVYNGTSFVAKPAKVWNGSTWVEKPMKKWTGSAWVTLT